MELVSPLKPDDLLARYYHSSAGDAELQALVSSVQEAIRSRISARASEREIVEDLCAEANLRLIVATRKSWDVTDLRIGNYRNYALTVADSVFEDYLRRTRPNWYRMKRKLVYLLDGRGGGRLFARWKIQADWLGGFARWSGHPFRLTAAFRALCENQEQFVRETLPDCDPPDTPLPTLMVRLFRQLETPLEVNTLTSHLFALQRLQEPTCDSLDAMEAAPHHEYRDAMALVSQNLAESIVDSVVSEQFRVTLWDILRMLPVRQRVALLLGMSTEEMLLLNSASQIADAVELPLSQLAELWPEFPLSDRAIAIHLDCTPKQVANLRKCARERIVRWLQKETVKEGVG